MKNLSQKGFIIPVVIAIISFTILIGVLYFYDNKKAEAPIINSEENIKLNDIELIDNEKDISFGKMMTIKLYFPNNILNPKMLDCSLVYPISRLIPDTKGLASATLNELIKGPTEEEKKNGYFSSIPVGTKVNSIKMLGDILYIDFNPVVVGGGGSCGQTAKFNSFMSTLKQFTTIKDIEMTVDGKGNTEDIFQP